MVRTPHAILHCDLSVTTWQPVRWETQTVIGPAPGQGPANRPTAVHEDESRDGRGWPRKHVQIGLIPYV
jgi:hypothetical protein